MYEEPMLVNTPSIRMINGRSINWIKEQFSIAEVNITTLKR